MFPWEGKDLFAQAPASTVKANLGSAHRNVEFLGDRLVGQVIDITQHDDTSQSWREVADRVIELVTQISGLGDEHGIPIGVLVHNDGVIDERFMAVPIAATEMCR